MKILLLSAYDAPSHRYWREGLIQQFPAIEFTQLILPPRHFSWRIRGNPLSWLDRPELQQSYDWVLATSMVDIATLRGLFPSLARVPTIYYFHENQFAYPTTALAHKSLEPQMVTLYGALAADKLVFNSDFNRRTFFEGVAALLNALPDHLPRNVIARLADKSQIVAVPLHPPGQTARKTAPPFTSISPLQMVWNHRWEYDKGPERLFALLMNLPAEYPFKWHIIGQQFRQVPVEFKQIHALLRARNWLGSWGYIREFAQYQQILAQSHAVVSTALHDFQGIAVLEAVLLGCCPIVPRRLAYPEWFGADNCYAENLQDINAEAKNAADVIMGCEFANLANTEDFAKPLLWENVSADYRQLFGLL